MREGLDGDDIFAELMMLRTSDARTFVLLEGPSDCRALDPHIELRSARTFPAYSKSALERTIALVDENQFERTLGVVDRDWVDVLFPPMDSENIVYTDDYDLDATILLGGDGDILERLISSVSDREQRASHLKSLGASAEECVVSAAATIGVARMLSVRDGHGVKFEAFPLNVCLDAKTGQVDIEKMSSVAISRSIAPKVDAAELTESVCAEIISPPDRKGYCSGHDLAAVVASFVRGQWGGGNITRDIVEKMARAALGCENLKRLNVYEAVKEWAARNQTTVWNCT